ncbi:hypothetical protein FGG08_001887 [Glutinoglossum americanum]|uniref:PITH domain-containing protein n=1 Tax=Glutinoglossum americanum TaxID=1670608 RepID=A0A9P8L4Y8_9PEZI|nr:hypothetical protein FGG08_001887 [Glutinoglossum americanum]
MASHCRDEHDDHDHGNGAGDIHDHTDDITPAIQSLLYDKVDFGNIRTLNETTTGSGAAIVKKTWAERLTPEPELESSADEQLLMYIPFSVQVKLHAILLRTSNSPSAPRSLRMTINRDDLDFTTAADLRPTQTLHLSQTSDVQEIPLKRALWNNTHAVTLFFEDNHSDGEEEVTRIGYIGFKGEWMDIGKAPVGFLYESSARLADHKVDGVKDNALGGSRLGM